MSPAISDEKRHGRHYTPAEVARFLAARTVGHLPGDDDDIVVLDPACGDGELLLAAAQAVSTAGGRRAVALRGYEIDEEAADLARSRLAEAGLSAEIICGDFLVLQRHIESASADVIITNPPYVRTQHLGPETGRALAAEFDLSGRVDLTHPFVTVAARLLQPGGVLGLLCSNRVLTTRAGENVRRTLLHDRLHVRELYDLGDTRLFPAAVLPAVIVAVAGETYSQRATFASAYAQPAAGDAPARPLFDALQGAGPCTALHRGKRYEVKVGTFVPPPDATTPWRLSDPESDEWLRTLQRGTWKTFGDIAKVRVGIKTTADNVFVSDRWDRDAPDVEEELLLPLITQSAIAPWRVSDSTSTRVLYPYDLSSSTRRTVDLTSWPGAAAYLREHEEQLRGRNYVIDSGREWWEIWVPQRPALWAKPKIVFPDISEQPRFALDTTGAVVNGNCYWISLADIADDDLAFLLLAVANSSLGVRFYDATCGNRLYSGKRRWITQYVSRLPLPFPGTAAAKGLIGLARRLAADDGAGPEAVAELDNAVEAAFAAGYSGTEISATVAP